MEKVDEFDTVNEQSTETEPTTASPYFGSAQEVVNRYCHCVVCGGNLHFTHQTDFSRNLTQETAKCPECGIKARQVLHKLQ